MVEATNAEVKKTTCTKVTIRLTFQGQFTPQPFTQNTDEETKDETAESPLMRKMTVASAVFEHFYDVDITKTTLHDVVQMVRERRDFSEKGIEAMLTTSKIYLESKDKPLTSIMLFPDYKDIVEDVEPLYTSSEAGASAEGQLTIEEEINRIQRPYDIIEDDFLPLLCEVVISDYKADQEESKKNVNPGAQGKQKSMKVLSAVNENYTELSMNVGVIAGSLSAVVRTSPKAAKSGSPTSANRSIR